MPVIRGNDVLTINGVRIAKQGAAHLKPEMMASTAAEKTKANGMDELIVAFEGPDGKAERMIIWGDDLNFSFRNQRVEPDIRLNGEPGMLVHFEDEPNGLFERMQRGVATGFTEAMDAIVALAKKAIASASLAGIISFIGGTIWVVATKGAAIGAMKSAAIILGPKIAAAGGATILVGVAFIVMAGVIKGMAGGIVTKMETIAAVIDDDPKKGIAGRHVADAPAAPAPPPAATRSVRGPAANAPAANAPAANRPAANAPAANRPAANAPAANAPAANAPAGNRQAPPLNARPLRVQ